MVASYFGVRFDPKQVRDWALPYGNGATMTVGLARSASELGIKVVYATRSLALDPRHFQKKFYQNYFSTFAEEKDKCDKLIVRFRELGGNLQERIYSLDEILQKFSPNSIPIVLVDWSIIRGVAEDYSGHFLPVIGYDASSVVVHHSGPKDPQARFRISRDLFDRARLAERTDADVLFLGRPREKSGSGIDGLLLKTNFRDLRHAVCRDTATGTAPPQKLHE